jgi:predicted metalloendopeptidase
MYDTKKRTIKSFNKTLKKSSIIKIDKNINKSKCSSNIKAFEEKYSNITDKHILQSQNNINQSLVKILRKQTVPKNILPNNDFYTFINYEWMKYTTLEKQKGQGYIVQLDDFRVVQNKVYYELMDIVKEYIKNNNSEKSKQIANVYNANMRFLDDTQAKKHLNTYIDFLDSCVNMENNDNGAWKFLGTMNKNETVSFGLPLVFSVNPDNKNSKTFRCFIAPPQLTLVDLNVYFNDGTDINYKNNYKKKYYEYIDELFTAFFGSNHKYNPKDVFDVEVKLLDAMGCSNIKNDSESFYNIVKKSESLDKYSFDWDSVSHEVGFKETPNFFIASSLNYLKCGSELYLKEWKTEQWRTYFIYIYIRQTARFHKTWRKIPFKFCGQFMRGQEELFPHELYPIFALSFSFNTFLTNSYIDKFANPQAIEYVKTFANDLKYVFTKQIERNKWLQPKTKKYALLKLKHFNFDVGSPKELREDPLLDYSPIDMWENLLKIVEWRTKNAINMEGKEVIDIPIIDWANYPLKLIGTQAYVVNASYTPTKNGIYIPLGYIQKPFVDLDERGIEYNLAHIGFTLGHEMSHSLDDMGSKYDYKGNMNDWWTPKDKELFKKKQLDVINQYETFAKRDGIIFDAQPGVGEDLADISGLAICIEYLRDFQDNNKDIIPIRVLSTKALLIYFAYQMRQKIGKKALTAQLKTNPHPLDKYRTNVPLSRIEIFRDMYNVKKGDGMYWHNLDTIW